MSAKKLVSFISLICLLLPFSLYAESVSRLFHQNGDPVAGNPKGNITIVEFFDYQCGHCVEMSYVLEKIIKANPQVRVVFKEFPTRGEMSGLASLAALASNKQGKYYSFSRALLTSDEPLTSEQIFALAKKSGVDVNRLKKDMQSDSVKTQLRLNARLADSLRLSGTPAFFIGKTDAKDSEDVSFVLGEMSRRQLQEAINNTK